MKKKREIGFEFEDLAKKYLLDKGMKYIESNFYTRYGEIDLIFTDEDEKILVFVEVRYRKNTEFAGQHGRRNFERSGKPLPHANRPPPHRLLRSIGRHRLRPPEARGTNRRRRHRPRLSDPQQPLVGHRLGFRGVNFAEDSGAERNPFKNARFVIPAQAG